MLLERGRDEKAFMCETEWEWQALGYSVQDFWEGIQEKKQVWQKGVKALRRNLFAPQGNSVSKKVVKVKSMNGTSLK